MRRGERGTVYLWLMGVLVVLGILLGRATEVVQTQAERQHEALMLVVGEAYRQAIASYVASGDGRLPISVDELLEDGRNSPARHHLRSAYPDPETGQAWALIRDEAGGILGVHSAAMRAPLLKDGFPLRYKAFEEAATLADWRFTYSATPARTAR